MGKLQNIVDDYDAIKKIKALVLEIIGDDEDHGGKDEIWTPIDLLAVRDATRNQLRSEQRQKVNEL